MFKILRGKECRRIEAGQELESVMLFDSGVAARKRGPTKHVASSRQSAIAMWTFTGRFWPKFDVIHGPIRWAGRRLPWHSDIFHNKDYQFKTKEAVSKLNGASRL